MIALEYEILVYNGSDFSNFIAPLEITMNFIIMFVFFAISSLLSVCKNEKMTLSSKSKTLQMQQSAASTI